MYLNSCEVGFTEKRVVQEGVSGCVTRIGE